MNFYVSNSYFEWKCLIFATTRYLANGYCMLKAGLTKILRNVASDKAKIGSCISKTFLSADMSPPIVIQPKGPHQGYSDFFSNFCSVCCFKWSAVFVVIGT